MGRLIVIEGLDGSGKETQSRQLVAQLQCNGIPARTLGSLLTSNRPSVEQACGFRSHNLLR